MGKWKVGSGAHEANGEWALGSRASGASRRSREGGSRRKEASKVLCGGYDRPNGKKFKRVAIKQLKLN